MRLAGKEAVPTFEAFPERPPLASRAEVFLVFGV